jgi:DNA-binding transcriptional regulator YhcF (GntR family)
VIGHVGSTRDCWAFQRTIAGFVRVSVRTVQRAIAQAKALGLVEVHRAKKREVPPGLETPLPCGWSHRWATSRGMGNARAQEAIAAARARQR